MLISQAIPTHNFPTRACEYFKVQFRENVHFGSVRIPHESGHALINEWLAAMVLYPKQDDGASDSLAVLLKKSTNKAGPRSVYARTAATCAPPTSASKQETLRAPDFPLPGFRLPPWLPSTQQL